MRPEVHWDLFRVSRPVPSAMTDWRCNSCAVSPPGEGQREFLCRSEHYFYGVEIARDSFWHSHFFRTICVQVITLAHWRQLSHCRAYQRLFTEFSHVFPLCPQVVVLMLAWIVSITVAYLKNHCSVSCNDVNIGLNIMPILSTDIC